ncbi:glycosyltransferase family 4 protein [Streptomyces triticiradicis]|uniref:D-inositol 3-phosphate glycosyltransferase n=1 Tax=Streptomyces triticiradicis TaxID=2651189 RepID=A0A7J5DPM4_9ACTN|nr:glycosyltransferase family 4 protein [Streptomyces triticiradicis]KAB1990632.1 glycosyltransferase family 4 protein [Streptomyces triticiradicis]
MTALNELARADILFLNWRDPSHPRAGGAEVFCRETARRFSAAGANVTVFTARHPGSEARSVSDGMLILRGGGTYGVYAAAARHLLRHRHTYDAVIDCQNGIPFFSPLFTPRWTADVCVVHHVHQNQFDLLLPRPLNLVGRVLEKQVSRVVYHGRPVVVVSPSTLEGIRRELGFRNPVYVVPNGSTLTAPAHGSDSRPPGGAHGRTPVIAVVSRLVPQKRLDLLVQAMPALEHKMPGVRLDIAGDGSELPRLRDLATRLGVSDAVTFHGRVSEERKEELLARAWLTVVPSLAEGWGLSVIEANAVGTPAVVFDVPGLRDAVRPGHTGWLLPPESDLAGGVADALAELTDAAVRRRMTDRCRSWAATFSWDDTAERLAAVVLEDMSRTRRHRHSRRRPSDLSVISSFRVTDANAMEQVLRHALRLTDAWNRCGDTFRVLLHGCDEVRAAGALRRLGVRPSELTLASRQDILVGTAGTTDRESDRTKP